MADAIDVETILSHPIYKMGLCKIEIGLTFDVSVKHRNALVACDRLK
jgi:hypothetical protein